MGSLQGKVVLVTGGAGFIGSHLVERLQQEGVKKVIVVDDLSLGKRENLDVNKCVFRAEKVQDYYRMLSIFDDNTIDVVFHCAAIPLTVSLENPIHVIESQTMMATVLCELLREGCYKTLVQFSSSEVYGTAKNVPMGEDHPLNPETPYAASKAAADLIALSYYRTFNCDVRIIRPFNQYGPRQNKADHSALIPRVIDKALREEEITIYGDGEQTRDFSYVLDTVDAAIRIACTPETKGEVINVGSGYELSVNDIVNEILSYLKSKSTKKHYSPRSGDVRRHVADTTKAYSALGYKAKTPLSIGLVKTIDWYKEEKQ